MLIIFTVTIFRKYTPFIYVFKIGIPCAQARVALQQTDGMGVFGHHTQKSRCSICNENVGYCPIIRLSKTIFSAWNTYNANK